MSKFRLKVRSAPTVNARPTTTDIAEAGNEDASGITVHLAGADADGSVASFVISTLPANGTLKTTGGVTLAVGDTVPASGNAATISFVPAQDWYGATSFTYTSRDNRGFDDLSPATATINVAAVNDEPTTADGSASGDQDTVITANLSGSDVDGTVATFVIISLPSNGTLKTLGGTTLSVNDTVAATANAAQVNFHPTAAWSGVTTFTYAARDDQAVDATPATITITVAATGAGDPPTITSPSSATVGDDAQLAFLLTANESVTWSLPSGADVAQFEISGSTLRWTSNGTRDFQAPADAGANNVYNVTVRATSVATGLTADKAVAITVAELSNVYNETLTLDLGRAGLVSTGALASVPSGNTVNLISVAGTANVYLNTFRHYTDGDTMLGPGPLWNGTADSGFNGVFPTDPTRTTAKPEIRPLTPWNERIDGDRTFCVAVFAAGGVQGVTFNLEGNEVTVTQPSHYYYDTLEGRHRVYWQVYCVTLDHAALRAQTVQSAGNSACNLFVTAIPNDPAMQSRVIGARVSTRTNMIAPIQFFPEATTHDYLIHLNQNTVNTYHGTAWPSAVATVNNISDALLLASGRSCPGIPRLNSPLPKATKIKAVADYQGHLDYDYMVAQAIAQGNSYGSANGWNIGKGYITICADPAYELKLGRTTYVDTNASFKSFLSGIEFVGANVIFDQTNENSCLDIGHQNMASLSTSNQGFWMRGCKVASDVDYQRYLGPTKDLMQGNLFPGYPNMPFFVTDSEVWHKPVSNCLIVANNDVRNWWVDQYTNSQIVWGNLTKGPDEQYHDGSRAAFTLDYNTAHPSAKNWAIAERVGYGATSGTRELRLSSGNDDISWTRDVTVNLATYTDAASVVAYINSLGTQWTATQTSTPGSTGDRNMRLFSRFNWTGDWTDNRQDVTNEVVTSSVGGTGNAITLDFGPDLPLESVNGGPLDFVNGQTIAFVATATNTGATTLDVDGRGARQFRDAANSNLTAGAITTGNYVVATWNAAAGIPTGSGCWILKTMNALRARRAGGAATQLALYTHTEIHCDFSQSMPADNVIMAYNVEYDTYGAQTYNWAETGGVRARDWFIGWNTWGTTGTGTILAGGGSYQNLRYVHNQSAGNLTLRNSAVCDAYTIMKNCIWGSLSAETVPTSPIDLADNHYVSYNYPVNAAYGNSNASTGVTPATLYPGILDGGAVPDETAFAVSGRTATRYAYAGTDLFGVEIVGSAPKGVAGFPLSAARSFTYAESQTIGLAADFDQPAGAGVKTLVFQWKDGPGNTGDDVQLTLTVDLEAA